jgi:hypothetical protein
MEQFVASEFQGHPKLTSYTLGHLFRQRATPTSVTTLQTKMTAVTKTDNAAMSLADKLKTKHGV